MGPVASIITAIFNLVMGGIALALGYTYGLMFLIVIGYVIAGLGTLMLLVNLFRLKKPRKNDNLKTSEKTTL